MLRPLPVYLSLSVCLSVTRRRCRPLSCVRHYCPCLSTVRHPLSVLATAVRVCPLSAVLPPLTGAGGRRGALVAAAAHRRVLYGEAATARGGPAAADGALEGLDGAGLAAGHARDAAVRSRLRRERPLGEGERGWKGRCWGPVQLQKERICHLGGGEGTTEK